MLLKISGKTQLLQDKIIKTTDQLYKNRGLWTLQKNRLSQLGIMYRLHNYQMKPSYYIILRVSIGLITTGLAYLLVNKINLLMPLFFVIGYLITDLYFKRQNEQDNNDMIIDLYNTYANLKTQLSVGIYLGESLSYSHKIASCKRYKEALGELILNMADKTITLVEAIDIFRNRFDNKEITKLCALMQNYTQYGVNDSYAADIMTEINALIEAQNLKAEHDIISKTDLVRFIFFAIIICVAMFAVLTQFSDVGRIFST